MRKVLYIFGLLTDGDIDWLAHAGRRRWLEPGEVVIEEGRAVSSLILVLDGRLAVSVRGLGRIAELAAGEVVGEMSFVDSAPPSATVAAQDRTLALFVDKAELSRQLESDMGFGYRFYRAMAVFLADRLRASDRRQAGPASRDVVLEDELDMGILDGVSMAGERFHRLLKTLSTPA